MFDLSTTETTRCNSCLQVFDCGEQSQQEATALPFRQPRTRDESEPGMKPLEELLASEMGKLSVHERSKALDDVHCVGDELHENPQIIEESLAKFEQKIQEAKNPIYEQAVMQNRAYVEEPGFRLKFIRATLHDVDKAVRNMLEFLRFKGTYFGIEKLARDITLDDLNEEDKQLLFSGFQHIQDGTDRMGRVIMFFFNEHMGRGEIGTHIRLAYFTMFNVLASMPAVQKKGFVQCYYDISKPGENFPKPSLIFLMNITNFLNCIPVRASALHLCIRTGSTSAGLNKLVLGLTLKMFPQRVRVRTRMHYGKDIEFQYELQGHGFPSDTFPVDANGNMRKDIQLAWLYKHQALQRLKAEPGVDEVKQSKAFSTNTAHDATAAGLYAVIDPPRHHILLGRGRPIQRHPGNVCFREYLKQYSAAYDAAPRNMKRKVLSRIKDDLDNRGIQFLQEKDGFWVECGAPEIEKTISQAFRNLRKKNKKEDGAI